MAFFGRLQLDPRESPFKYLTSALSVSIGFRSACIALEIRSALFACMRFSNTWDSVERARITLAKLSIEHLSNNWSPKFYERQKKGRRVFGLAFCPWLLDCTFPKPSPSPSPSLLLPPPPPPPPPPIVRQFVGFLAQIARSVGAFRLTLSS